MKRIFLLVAMTFITSLASAQITSEQFNQINFKVSQQTMIEQLQSYRFDYNYYGNIGGMIDNELIEITFKTSQNGVIEEMRVIEMKSLDEREYAARVAELKEMPLIKSGKITLDKQSPAERKYNIVYVYR